MSSERKIRANRLNGRKSRGPRSAAGKSNASRNALRHGLAAIVHRQPVSSEEIERFARALCGSDADPSLFEQAQIIANNELVLRAISAQQLAVVERAREPTTRALVKGDNSLKLARARSCRCREAYDELIRLRDQLLQEYKDELPPPIFSKEQEETMPELDVIIPPHLWEFLENKEDDFTTQALKQKGVRLQTDELVRERDESAAMEEAARDLVRLDRYERRARSRQRRAMHAFLHLKFMKQLASLEQ
jgi:hypothetical protein